MEEAYVLPEEATAEEERTLEEFRPNRWWWPLLEMGFNKKGLRSVTGWVTD
jgi:hypothetical protein